MAPKLDEFNSSARNLLRLSMVEAARLGHNYLGTEHLLLGFAAERSTVLQKLGFDLESARRDVLEWIPAAENPPPHGTDEEIVVAVFGEGALAHDPAYPPYTPRVMRMLEAAAAHASKAGDGAIDAAHLLQAVAMDPSGVASQLMVKRDPKAPSIVQGAVAEELSWRRLIDLVREADRLED